MKKSFIYLIGAITHLLLINSNLSVAQNTTSTPKSDSTHIKFIDRFSKKYTGVVVDSATNEPIQSAVVYLMGVSDIYKDIITKSTVTDRKGRFEILVAGPSKLEISCLGYKLHTQRVYPQRGYQSSMTNEKSDNYDLGKIKMSPDPFAADEVVVRSRIQMFEQRGDTTRIFPRLAKTLEGDALIEVLKQIPGFKVEGSSIYENGKLIERTYVNNTLLFGQSPITAFLKLSAESALTIDTYDEKISEAERNLTNRQNETRRVANITTSKKISEYITMMLRAEAGLDHDKDIDGDRHKRYGLAGDLGIYKVGKQFAIDAKNNNMTVSEFGESERKDFLSGNPKKTEINLRYERQIGDSIYDEKSKKKAYVNQAMLISSYSFKDNRNSNESKSTSEYFPTNYFEIQNIENASHSMTNTQDHRANLNYMNYRQGFPIRVSLNTTYSKGDNINQSLSTTTTDGTEMSKTENNNNSESNRFGIRGGISLHNTIVRTYRDDYSHMISLDLESNVDYTKNRGDGFRNYSLTDQYGTNLTNISLESESPNLNIGNRGGLNYGITNTITNNSVSVELSAIQGYQRSKEYKIAINQATNEIDEAYSGDYTRNNNILSASLSLARGWNNKGISFRTNISYEKTTVKNDERIPTEVFNQKDFNDINFRVGLMFRNFSFSLNSQSRIPNVEQLSSILNNTNPLSLSAGNPNLKNSRVYTANLYFNNRSLTKTNKVNINTSINASYTTDPITQIRHYFKESTTLTDYEDYVAPAGATLYIPENVDSYFAINGRSSISLLVQRFNATLEFTLSGSHSNPYASINDELVRNKQSDANIGISILCTPSRKFRVSIKNNFGYSWQENDYFKDRSCRNQFSANLRWDFMNRLIFSPEFTSNVSKAYTTGKSLEQNSLNLSLGTRLLRKRNGLLSINVYNIFNDKSGYSLSINDQAITEAWNQKFARFYSISFQYKFNSIDHTK